MLKLLHEQCFPVVLFLMLYKIFLTFDFQSMESLVATIHVKAVEQYFPVELLIMLDKVV